MKRRSLSEEKDSERNGSKGFNIAKDRRVLRHDLAQRTEIQQWRDR